MSGSRGGCRGRQGLAALSGLRGRSYGVDFDPAADRLRVISDIGQNLRPHLDDPQRAPAAARR
ncbi:DUF4394 domain-containing protein [Streptomyces ossamyceticus]|uniref:DUF4394 domain-containing protein n=1 Tax=Streptomyces ossamyceticus TaxID=249581 RepID=UPI0039C93D7E